MKTVSIIGQGFTGALMSIVCSRAKKNKSFLFKVYGLEKNSNKGKRIIMPFLGTTPQQGFTSHIAPQIITNHNGVLNIFTLTHQVASENDIEVFVGNVRQEPGANKSYTAIGNQLNMVEAPPADLNFYIIYKGQALVTSTSVLNSNITGTEATTTPALYIDSYNQLGFFSADTPSSTTTKSTIYNTDASLAIHASSHSGTDKPIKLLTNTTAGSAALTVMANGNVEVDRGDLVMGTSGKGIDFSTAAGSASGSTSAVLDDYEEGTATVAFTAGSGSITIGSSQMQDKLTYVKIGGVVHFKGRFTVGSISSPSGELGISGLPFASGNPSGDAAQVFTVYFENASSTIGTDIIGIIGDASQTASIRKSGETDAGATLAGHVDTGTVIIISGTYFTYDST